MSAQTMHDVFASWEAHYRELQIQDTWGHLAPKKNKTYKGRVVFAIGLFGNDPLNPLPIVCEFKNLDSSPWFYDSLNNFLQDLVQQQRDKEIFNEPVSMPIKSGCVYEFAGTFRNYEYNGAIKLLHNYEDAL
jgi:hypothetical protein